MKVLFVFIAMFSASQVVAAEAAKSLNIAKAACMTEKGNAIAGDFTVRKMSNGQLYFKAGLTVRVDKAPELTPSKKSLMSLVSDKKEIHQLDALGRLGSRINKAMGGNGFSTVSYENSVILINEDSLKMRVMRNYDNGQSDDSSVNCVFAKPVDVVALEKAIQKL